MHKQEPVRQLFTDGVSKSEIARRLAIGRTSVRRLLSLAFCSGPDDVAHFPVNQKFRSNNDQSGISRVILFLHGGGYVFGSTATHRPLVVSLARAAGVRALSLDYRLAPENPFPAAVEDAVRGYQWLLAQGAEPARIVIAGDSGGGGLTLAALDGLARASRGGPAIKDIFAAGRYRPPKPPKDGLTPKGEAGYFAFAGEHW